jgi:ABC-type uncharacterized transport system YnjBCD ATPase subunit
MISTTKKSTSLAPPVDKITITLASGQTIELLVDGNFSFQTLARAWKDGKRDFQVRFNGKVILTSARVALVPIERRGAGG